MERFPSAPSLCIASPRLASSSFELSTSLPEQAGTRIINVGSSNLYLLVFHDINLQISSKCFYANVKPALHEILERANRPIAPKAGRQHSFSFPLYCSPCWVGDGKVTQNQSFLFGRCGFQESFANIWELHSLVCFSLLRKKPNLLNKPVMVEQVLFLIF